jgi:hypothetical protein
MPHVFRFTPKVRFFTSPEVIPVSEYPHPFRVLSASGKTGSTTEASKEK